VGQLVTLVFNEMQLAGEAGTLLKIEEELRDAIHSAKAVWQRGPRLQQLALLPEEQRQRAEQLAHEFDVSGISDETFWERVEQCVLDALRAFVSEATDGHAIQRRLFTEDALQGFAFVDLCRKRFDVVLMNPPFGASSTLAKSTLERDYPRTKNDVYAAFVERGVQLLCQRGMLGAVTSRTGFFLSSFQRWREEVLLREAPPIVVADLGYGVLDAAMVEVAAYCLEKAA
jgi:hypothetical protein